VACEVGPFDHGRPEIKDGDLEMSFVSRGCVAAVVFLLVGTIAGSASAQGEPIAEINGNKIYALDVHNAYAAERPEFVQKIRFDDNAARTLAMDWYRAQLFKQAAIDEGYHQANPATLPQGNRIRDQYVAAEYLTWLLGKKYKPSEMELRQIYQMQPGLCASNGKVRLARAGVIWGRNASPEEIAAAEDRFAEIQKRLAAGESFGQVADDASDFRTSGTGGDTGWVDIKTLQGNPLGEKVLALSPGERSEVISLPESRGLFEMLDVEAAGALSFENCRARLEEAIARNYRNDVRRRRVNELADKYNASLNLDAFITVVRAIPAPGDPRPAAKQP
jgi:hypothetical protein